MNYSIVHFFPERSSHSCGYCKSNDGSQSDGMWAHTMTTQDYQDLIDRGWRRSGSFCYKPKMDTTCCPAYTIRCAALEIQLTKSQKKILKRMRKYLIDGKKSGTSEADFSVGDEDAGESNAERVRFDQVSDTIPNISVNNLDTSMLDSHKDVAMQEEKIENPSSSSDDTVITPSSSTESTSSEHTNLNSKTSQTNQKKNPHSGLGQDISKPQMKKAKLIRLERREKKMAKLNSQENQPSSANKKSQPKSKTLEEFINEALPEGSKHTLEVRVVNLTDNNQQTEEQIREELKLYQKYQVSIHRDPIEKCSLKQFTNFLVQSPFKIKLVKSGSKEHDVQLEWSLYAKYQMKIHKDKKEDCDMTNFHDFLIDSPLKCKENPDGPPTCFGSYHQQYWLDGKLIAVGVIDILPYCVSSVYFFYDPEYSFLSLGTYSSLREVEFVRSLNRNNPSLMYYYMGFYIHSCPKMRYKSKIGPSYLLCPEVYTWHHIESCIPKLDKNKYSKLNDDANVVCKDSVIELNRVLILWKNVTVDYARFKRLNKKPVKTDIILHYAKLVGKTCSQRMLLYM